MIFKGIFPSLSLREPNAKHTSCRLVVLWRCVRVRACACIEHFVQKAVYLAITRDLSSQKASSAALSPHAARLWPQALVAL